jgi:hypothetical protein
MNLEDLNRVKASSFSTFSILWLVLVSFLIIIILIFISVSSYNSVSTSVDESETVRTTQTREIIEVGKGNVLNAQEEIIKTEEDNVVVAPRTEEDNVVVAPQTEEDNESKLKYCKSVIVGITKKCQKCGISTFVSSANPQVKTSSSCLCLSFTIGKPYTYTVINHTPVVDDETNLNYQTGLIRQHVFYAFDISKLGTFLKQFIYRYAPSYITKTVETKLTETLCQSCKHAISAAKEPYTRKHAISAAKEPYTPIKFVQIDSKKSYSNLLQKKNTLLY